MQTSAVSFLLPEPWTPEGAGQDVALVTRAAHLAYVGVPLLRGAGLPASPYLAGSEPPDPFRGDFPCQRQRISSLHVVLPSPPPACAIYSSADRFASRLHQGAVVAQVSGLKCAEEAGPTPTFHALPLDCCLSR